MGKGRGKAVFVGRGRRRGGFISERGKI